MSELSKSLGSMEYDGLIADINPKLVVSGGTIRKLGTADDVTAPVYLMGCFNSNKVTVADSYTMTETDKDALRNGGIVFKAAAPAL